MIKGRKLLSTTSLVRASFLATVIAASTIAYADESPAKEIAAEDYYYSPVVEWGGKFSKGRKLTELNYMQPIFAKNDHLPMIDLKLKLDNYKSREINLGLAYRYNYDENFILGAYGYFDHRTTGNNFGVKGITVGAEFLSNYVDARANFYLPEASKKKIKHNNKKKIEIQGTSIFAVSGGHRYEYPMKGYDVEVGAPIFAFSPELNERFGTRVFAAKYEFTNKHTKNISGLRFRFEHNLAQTWIGNNNLEFKLTGETQYDNVRKRQNFIGVSARLTFDDKKNSKKRSKGSLKNRMMSTIVRDVDIVTTDANESPTISSFKMNGREVKKIYYVGEADGTYQGNGTQASPLSIEQLEGMDTSDAIIVVTSIDKSKGGKKISKANYKKLMAKDEVVNGKEEVLLTASKGEDMVQLKVTGKNGVSIVAGDQENTDVVVNGVELPKTEIETKKRVAGGVAETKIKEKAIKLLSPEIEEETVKELEEIEHEVAVEEGREQPIQNIPAGEEYEQEVARREEQQQQRDQEEDRRERAQAQQQAAAPAAAIAGENIQEEEEDIIFELLDEDEEAENQPVNEPAAAPVQNAVQEAENAANENAAGVDQAGVINDADFLNKIDAAIADADLRAENERNALDADDDSDDGLAGLFGDDDELIHDSGVDRNTLNAGDQALYDLIAQLDNIDVSAADNFFVKRDKTYAAADEIIKNERKLWRAAYRVTALMDLIDKDTPHAEQGRILAKVNYTIRKASQRASQIVDSNNTLNAFEKANIKDKLSDILRFNGKLDATNMDGGQQGVGFHGTAARDVALVNSVHRLRKEYGVLDAAKAHDLTKKLVIYSIRENVRGLGHNSTAQEISDAIANSEHQITDTYKNAVMAYYANAKAKPNETDAEKQARILRKNQAIQVVEAELDQQIAPNQHLAAYRLLTKRMNDPATDEYKEKIMGRYNAYEMLAYTLKANTDVEEIKNTLREAHGGAEPTSDQIFKRQKENVEKLIVALGQSRRGYNMDQVWGRIDAANVKVASQEERFGALQREGEYFLLQDIATHEDKNSCSHGICVRMTDSMIGNHQKVRIFDMSKGQFSEEFAQELKREVAKLPDLTKNEIGRFQDVTNNNEGLVPQQLTKVNNEYVLKRNDGTPYPASYNRVVNNVAAEMNQRYNFESPNPKYQLVRRNEAHTVMQFVHNANIGVGAADAPVAVPAQPQLNLPYVNQLNGVEMVQARALVNAGWDANRIRNRFNNIRDAGNQIH